MNQTNFRLFCTTLRPTVSGLQCGMATEVHLPAQHSHHQAEQVNEPTDQSSARLVHCAHHQCVMELQLVRSADSPPHKAQSAAPATWGTASAVVNATTIGAITSQSANLTHTAPSFSYICTHTHHTRSQPQHNNCTNYCNTCSQHMQSHKSTLSTCSNFRLQLCLLSSAVTPRSAVLLIHHFKINNPNTQSCNSPAQCN